ncbi:MAG: endonuclease III [Verrucomicrobia bacterium]|nr:endonuclease III [Verrucomicrobiota bacterium]MBV8641540.1 endonuclease III [Verrucomicrobiota bacterium]
MKTKERLHLLIQKLHEVYPSAHCELEFETPFQLLVATILSAQCTDKRVNIVTRDLFQKYRSAYDFVEVSQDELEQAIKSTGFYRNKAKNLRAMSKDLVEKHGGEVPNTMAELTRLAGVGRKTANVVLGNAFSVDEGIVVDTHVARLAKRFKLTTKNEPEKIEEDLMRLVPRTQWTNFSHWLIWHGRRRCYARNPDCPKCEIGSLCPSYGKLAKRSQPNTEPASRKKAIA